MSAAYFDKRQHHESASRGFCNSSVESRINIHTCKQTNTTGTTINTRIKCKATELPSVCDNVSNENKTERVEENTPTIPHIKSWKQFTTHH